MTSHDMALPSVLLLDDGELDAVHRMLQHLGADVERVQGRAVGTFVPCPRDLLITSIQRSLERPELALAGCPTWVCFHNQDFMPLRDRLRELGVHFLMHSSLDPESMRLFLLQMLYPGTERRGHFRLPMGTEAVVVEGADKKPARLAELSSESCRILGTRRIRDGESLQIILSEALGGGEELVLEGTAIRSTPGESDTGSPIHSTVIRLDRLDAETRGRLEQIVGGEQIGTPMTPLAKRSETAQVSTTRVTAKRSAPPPPLALVPAPDERREAPRHTYERRVELLELRHSNTDGSALGHDLSLTGVRVVGYPEMDAGAQITLALYGGRREEPVVIPAEVVRGLGPNEVAFRFGPLSDSQRMGLEKLTVGLGPLTSLEEGAEGKRVVITQIVEPE